ILSSEASQSILSSAAISGDCNSIGACGLYALSYWLGVVRLYGDDFAAAVRLEPLGVQTSWSFYI
ncbi:hypothetical protein U1Q18_042062, partial [Sarracenia purpurea var. burkii]